MSGGAMDYICYRFDEYADMVEDKEISELLRDLGKVLHDEEWYKSADIGKEEYLETLSAFKRKWFNGSREERLRGIINGEIDRFKNRLNEMI